MLIVLPAMGEAQLQTVGFSFNNAIVLLTDAEKLEERAVVPVEGSSAFPPR